MASAARKQVLAMIMTVQTLTCYGRMPLPIPAPASRARTSTKGLLIPRLPPKFQNHTTTTET
eukprot:818755-Amphidinium_carterae.1